MHLHTHVHSHICEYTHTQPYVSPQKSVGKTGACLMRDHKWETLAPQGSDLIASDYEEVGKYQFWLPKSTQHHHETALINQLGCAREKRVSLVFMKVTAQHFLL